MIKETVVWVWGVPHLPWVVLAIVIAYYMVVYPLWVSPLRHIPGPYWSRVSRFHCYNSQRQGTWVGETDALHRRYGSVVIKAPDEISVAGPSYVTAIYTKNMPKSTFYQNFRNHGFRPNMFASLDNETHLKYKKIIMGLYKRSRVFEGSTKQLVLAKVADMVEAIERESVEGIEPNWRAARGGINTHAKGHSKAWFSGNAPVPMEVFTLFGALAMDVITGFELGASNSSQLLQHQADRDILILHRMQTATVFWTTLMPQWWDYAVDSATKSACNDVEQWQFAMYARAEANPVPGSVIETLRNAGYTGKDAYSMLTDNIFAGHETTAVQLTYLVWELSRKCNSKAQQKLADELTLAFGKYHEGAVIDDLEKLDSLPYLQALIDESGRVHSSIPGAEPRVTPAPFCVNLDSGEIVKVPKDTIISVQPYTLHHNPDVFPAPDEFIPDRWLRYPEERESDWNERIRTMNKYMMPFGKGIRMCLGMQLALIEIKLALATIYWRFTSSVSREWAEKESEGPVPYGHPAQLESDVDRMAMYDSYTTRPYNDECWIVFQEQES
ncbi:hypothetical protein DICA1_E09186 [Diutina catenulata]